MKKIIKPAILKKVIIWDRPIDLEKREEKIISLLVWIWENEDRIYEFIQWYDSIFEWVEEYLNDKLNLETEEWDNFILNLINKLIEIDYYSSYYIKSRISKVIKDAFEIILKSINEDFIKYSEEEKKFIFINYEEQEKLNKDIYDDLFKEFNNLKK